MIDRTRAYAGMLIGGGLTISELGKYMHELGCKEALNLDGGKSSTMVYNNEVLTNPTVPHIIKNKIEAQTVTDSILILPY